ncbi:hypothetical protein LENED_006373 [Lentinula edodes]|uniref:Uncharacterized protein n=1 Tax=Lentinula edodes TaxID=5353 RepID=A0A1Q3EBH8_LENED|nr:hypothetical protein LENED_006373 [Lentinula edodes]
MYHLHMLGDGCCFINKDEVYYRSLLYRNSYIEENVLLVAHDCDNHRLRCTPPLWWLLKLLLDNGPFFKSLIQLMRLVSSEGKSVHASPVGAHEDWAIFIGDPGVAGSQAV